MHSVSLIWISGRTDIVNVPHSACKVEVYFLCIITVLLHHTTGSQLNVTLTSTLHAGNISCPRDEIIFTCTISGMRVQTLYWSSNEYIGSSGEQLEFSTSNMVGKRLNSSVDPNTFAVLNISNSTVLQSKLHIVSNQSSEVSCLASNSGKIRSINFTTFGESMSDSQVFLRAL